MARPQSAFEDLHVLPTYTRLNEEYFAKLKRLAKKRDVPVAVLSRQLIVEALDRILLEHSIADSP